MEAEKVDGNVIQVNFEGEKAKDYRPDAFIEIIGVVDLSEMIQDNHLKILINGKEYWIPFVEKINKKGGK